MVVVVVVRVGVLVSIVEVWYSRMTVAVAGTRGGYFCMCESGVRVQEQSQCPCRKTALGVLCNV